MCKDHIKVSVIILTFNHENYIKYAIDSVLSQKTAFPFEVLIGDDASSDSTSAFLRSYPPLNNGSVRIFIREQNLGGTASLVDLVQKATGEYIAGCEGDDYWTNPYKLQKQVDFLDAHPEYIGCTHAVTLVDEDGLPRNWQKLNWVLNKKRYQFQDFRGIYLPGHPVSLVHRNIFKKNESMCSLIKNVHRNVADRTIAMLLSANGDIAWSSDNMACYRQMKQKDRHNLSNLVFAMASDSKLTEFKMTNRLETYAVEELGRSANFNSFRINLLVRSLGKALLYSSKAEFRCFKSMLSEWRDFRLHRK